MRNILPGSADSVPQSTYVELVASLFATQMPSAIMTLLFVLVGSLVQHRTHDPLILSLVLLGTIASAVRLAIVFRDGPRVREPMVSAATARAVERRFAASYLAFAAVLSAFGARAFQLKTPEVHMLVGILLVGYCAGAAAGTALRPRISVSSLLLAALPASAVALTTPDPVYYVSAVCLLAFLLGGIRSLVERYRSEVSKTTRRQAFSMLARQDHLTGLPNRLALTERFAELLANAGKGEDVAVHCLDLDDFKPVNDTLGHPAGDALLQAVAKRLSENIRGDDFPARLGGDEFIFVQAGIKHDHEAATMAHRLERCLGEPYLVGAERIVVGASIGFAVAGHADAALDRLVQIADDALRLRKARRKASTAGTIVPFASPRYLG